MTGISWNFDATSRLRRFVVASHPGIACSRLARHDDFADRDDRAELDPAQLREPLGPGPGVGDRLLVRFLLELVEVVENEADQARRDFRPNR